MLQLVRLVEQWRSIEQELPAAWAEARLELQMADERQAARAAAILGPTNPGRSGSTVRFAAARGGAGAGPDAIARLLNRLDRERIAGTLTLADAREREAPADAGDRRPSLAAAWTRELAGLPDDWSDLLGQVDFRSSDQLDRAALLLAPLNPTRYGEATGFRFRAARRFGYGASPQMVRRCLERCDEERIVGRIEILRVLSDTKPVATQGPVWYVGGKAV
jgi:hypothetical protein